MKTVTVRTVPLEPGLLWMDCTVCGPLGTSPPDQAPHTARDHLETEHGITQIDHRVHP